MADLESTTERILDQAEKIQDNTNAIWLLLILQFFQTLLIAWIAAEMGMFQ